MHKMHKGSSESLVHFVLFVAALFIGREVEAVH